MNEETMMKNTVCQLISLTLHMLSETYKICCQLPPYEYPLSSHGNSSVASINIAAFLVLCIDCPNSYFRIWDIAILCFTLTHSFLKLHWLTSVNYITVIFLFPFILLSLIAIPKIHPHIWLRRWKKNGLCFSTHCFGI